MLDGARNGTQAAMRAWVYAALFVPSGRVLAKLLLMKFRLWQRNLIVIGSGRVAFDAAAAIESEPLMGFCIRGFVQVGDDVPPTNTPLLRFRPTDASLLAEAHVLVAIEEKHAAARSAWLRALNSYRATNVMLVTDVSGVPLHGAATTYVKSHDLLLVQVRDNLSRWHVRLAKRCLDLAGAIAVSLVLSPLLLFIAWRVRRDGGRAIYGHPRIGRDGRAFRCYKFRSMVVDADRVLAELLKNDVTAREEWERDFKLKNDPRVTRIGRFLRRTSLDELPQLWNVIRGEMSLVGPRPIVEAELLRYGDDSCYYLMARPGMTGLWQVSGRNDADYRTRVYLDAWYVRNWSLWYDVAILFKTALVVFRRDGAY
jgi:undecaprenyl-phosphate galactose phosphotransferase